MTILAQDHVPFSKCVSIQRAAMARPKTVIPFCLFVSGFIYMMITYNRCDMTTTTKSGKGKRPLKKVDCGYSGMTHSSCYTTAFWGKSDTKAQFIKLVTTFSAVGFTCWGISGYPFPSIFWYLVLSAILSWHMSNCCHEDNVGHGIPHCFKPRSVDALKSIPWPFA
mmetsp:Transcript_115875/g.205200  ORF Transcript_115875/g.205200 Transcript_115875/m.205200 type:complete len:166 (+) Transcript_115875:3-500(+)